MDASEASRMAAYELMRTWGGKPRVFCHGDETGQHIIHVAQYEDSPTWGITAVGTVGLSDYDLGMGEVRVELVGAFPTAFIYGPNVAATCAFNAFKDRVPTRPDAIHLNVLSLYDEEATLPHVLMVDPYLWQDGPMTLDCDELKIAWLMMVPIAESERVFLAQHGPDVLTTLFEKHQIDIFDLQRLPVV